MAANLGFTPQNNGEIIRIQVPPLTRKRRRDFGKKCQSRGETPAISIRNARRDGVDVLKKYQKTVCRGCGKRHRGINPERSGNVFQKSGRNPGKQGKRYHDGLKDGRWNLLRHAGVGAGGSTSLSSPRELFYWHE